MTDPILKLQILARSELSLVRIQAKRNINQIVIMIASLVFILLGLAMFNFAGYQALLESRSPAESAMIVAITDILLAFGIVFYSRNKRSDTEQEEMIKDIRDLAYNELSADFDEAKQNFSEVSDDVRRIRTGFNTLTKGTAGFSNSLTPLLGAIIGALKKSK